jgi:hypothetical protein
MAMQSHSHASQEAGTEGKAQERVRASKDRQGLLYDQRLAEILQRVSGAAAMENILRKGLKNRVRF